MSKPKLKLFVVRKYIMAESAHDALKRERKHRPDEVFIEDGWQKANPTQLESVIGFHVEQDYYSSDDWAKYDNTKRNKNRKSNN